jgi:cell wall-associated NlpC family hydrolase
VSDAVQDQVANWEFTRDYKQDSGNPVDTGNVWMWVAEQHFDSTYAVPADQDVAPGDNGGETMADYGNAVVGYMTTQPWINSGSSSTATTDSAQADYSGSCNATELSGPLADQIVEIASNNLGLTQFGGNTVYGPNAWGPLGEEWCAFFSSWVLDQAGITPPPGSVPNVGVLETILVSEGGTQLAPTATPQPGDLVFFGSPADPLHVAIVSQVLADGDIAVIGGNEGTNDSTTSTVDQSTPFNPADAAAEGWPHVPGSTHAIWAYVQPVGV